MEINVSDLTTMDLQGDGAFDNIMTAMQTRLDREFKKNRLLGPEYAKVYLGSYEASLMNAVQFVLGRQEAGAKADLIKEQTKTEIEQRKLVVAQISKMKAEERLIDGQIDKMQQEILVMKGEVDMIPHKIELLKAEVIKMQKEGDLIDGQIRKMEQEVLLMKGQVDKMEQEILVMKGEVSMIPGKLKLINAQADKAVKEVDLITQQIEKMTQEVLVMQQQVLESIQKVETMKASVWAERAKTNSDCGIFDEDYNPKTTCTGTVSGLVGMQITKALAEGELIGQKVVTELAQTNDLVDTPERIVTGVIGKQKALFQKQTEGFDRDAEQKLSKIMVDTWNVRRTTDDNYSAGGTGLEDDQINNVLDIAKDGIGAPPNDFVGGGGNSGEISGITVDIVATTDVLEDCHATFESHVTRDNLPTVSIKSWEWFSPEGRELDYQHKVAGDVTPYLFTTGFWEPGMNPITLKITLIDSDTDSIYNNHVITFTKDFYATATDGGCIGGIRPQNARTTPAEIAENAEATAYSKAHPEEHGLAVATPANNGLYDSDEGHKGQVLPPKTTP